MKHPVRKFIGMTVLFVFVIAYAFAAMVIGDLKLQQASDAMKMLYFGVAGLVWTIPAGAIIWWMEHGFRLSRRPDGD